MPRRKPLPFDRYGRPGKNPIVPLYAEPQEVTEARRAKQAAVAARRRAMNEAFRRKT